MNFKLNINTLYNLNGAIHLSLENRVLFFPYKNEHYWAVIDNREISETSAAMCKQSTRDDDSSCMTQRSGIHPHRLPCLWLTWKRSLQPQPGLLQVHPPTTSQDITPTSALHRHTAAQTTHHQTYSFSRELFREKLNSFHLVSLAFLITSPKPAVKALPWLA